MSNYGRAQDIISVDSLDTRRDADTITIASEITTYRFENNRRYHAYRDGEYWGPNDEQQNNQLDIAHHLYLLTLHNRLFLAPIGPSPRHVLDVGTGTGIWAMDFADQYPSSTVTGFDLSPTQPTWVAPNVHFEINDACASDWCYPKDHFDFIHVRGMYGSVADWPAFYSQVMEHLAPGGWIEQVEMSVTPVSDDGSIPPGHIFQRWGDISLEAGEQFGKTLRIHEQAKGLMEEAGFTEVREVVFKWPIGPWSRDPHLKQVGLWNQLHWEEGIEGWSIALLTRVLGWSYVEVQVYLSEMRAALRDRRVHAYHLLNVVYARKPLPKTTNGDMGPPPLPKKVLVARQEEQAAQQQQRQQQQRQQSEKEKEREREKATEAPVGTAAAAAPATEGAREGGSSTGGGGGGTGASSPAAPTPSASSKA